MTLEELQTEILNEIEARDTLVNKLEAAANDEVHATHTLEQKSARSYLSAVTDGEKRTVAHLEAMTTISCEMENLTAKLAKAKLSTIKSRLAAHSEKISALQSVLSASRTELNALRYGQGAGA